MKSLIFGLLSTIFFLTGCGGEGEQSVINPVTIQPITEMRILVLGQSISSNCNDHVYGPSPDVYQVSKTGEIKVASDPFDWADCNKGSMWMPLGKKIVESGLARKVVFMPIGVSGSKVEDWQPGGSAFYKLNSALNLALQHGINFDFVFWHQGSSDIGTEKLTYNSRLNSVIDYVNNKVKVDRWLIAVHSRCAGQYDAGIEAAQISIGSMHEKRQFFGPNTNMLGNEFRTDACHLNKSGQEKMASLWLDSIKISMLK